MSYSINFTITNIHPDGTEEVYTQPIELEPLGFYANEEIFSIPSIVTDEHFGYKDMLLVKKSSYNEAQRLAQKKYREKYPEKYCKVQRDLYHNKKIDEEWRKKFNERSKINNKKYREKKREELKALGITIKSRGRPRKILEEPETEVKDKQEIVNQFFSV